MKGTYHKRTIFLQNIDYSKPKHYFTVIGDKLRAFIKEGKKYSLLDAGGATGAFCYYIKERFKNVKTAVLECDKKLIEEGTKRIKDCKFILGDVSRMRIRDKSYDITTCLGTIGFFDEFTDILDGLVRVTKKGGAVYIFCNVNDYPIDCLIRYRYANDKKGWLHTGYNMFSRQSFENYFKSKKEIKSFSFEKFRIPFDIPPQANPIKTWTEMHNGERMIRNGVMYNNFYVISLYV